MKFKKGVIPNNVKDLWLLINNNNGENMVDEIGIIPHGVTHLHLNYQKKLINQLKPGIIPNSVVELDYNGNIDVGVIPNSVIKLGINWYDEEFCKKIEPGEIPYGVKELSLGMVYNYPLYKGMIPKSVEKLELSFDFNHPIEIGDIPYGVKDLHLGVDFNKPLKKGVIPDSVIILWFSDEYNHPLDPGIIPQNVKKLYLSNSFTCELEEGSIPYGVEILWIGKSYDKVLKKGIIPSTVKFLDIYSRHDILREDSIPHGTIKVHLGYENITKELYIPDSVYFLDLSCTKHKLNINSSPNNIKILHVNKNFEENNPEILDIIPKLYEYKTSYESIFIKENFDKFNGIILTNHPKYVVCYHIYKGSEYTEDEMSYDISKKDDFDIYIGNFTKDKFIGNVICKELCEKIFEPSRLIKFCKDNNLSFCDLMNIY